MERLAPMVFGPSLVREVLERLSTWASEATGRERARIYLIDRARNELHCQIHDARDRRDVRLPVDTGLHARALASKTVQRGLRSATEEALAIIPVLAPPSLGGAHGDAEVIALLELVDSLNPLDTEGEAERFAVAADGIARVLVHTGLDDSRLAPERITNIVGSSEAMLTLYSDIERVKDAPGPVLLVGSPGTEKAQVAEAIHALGTRRGTPILTVRCRHERAFSEAELFGIHGPRADESVVMPGAVARAARGTLLVERADLLSKQAQSRLCDQAAKHDVRLIATVHSSLPRIDVSSWLEDRLIPVLRVNVLYVPTLAERGPDDIAMLARHFVREYASSLSRTKPSLDPAALDRLRSHSWPGNVKGLKRCLEAAVLACEGDTIELHHLSLPGEASGRAPDSIPSGLLLADAEQRYILRTLTENHQNRTRTASSLGIGRNTLVRKIKQYQNK